MSGCAFIIAQQLQVCPDFVHAHFRTERALVGSGRDACLTPRGQILTFQVKLKVSAAQFLVSILPLTDSWDVEG